MGAVGGPEGVHDIDVAQSGQFGGQFGIVLLFALEEADVLQQHHFTGSGLGGVEVGGQLHGTAQQAGKVGSHRRQGELFFHHAFGGTAQMREQDHARALVQRHADAGQGRTDTFVVGDAAILHGHVEILADDNGLAAALHVLQQSDGHVCLLFVREGITGKGRDTASGLSKRYVPRRGKSSPAPKVKEDAVSGISGNRCPASRREDGMVRCPQEDICLLGMSGPSGDTDRHPFGVRQAMSCSSCSWRQGHGCGPIRPRPPAWNLSSLGRTQKGPGPGDMSSRDPGPWFHTCGGALKHRPLSATAHVSP